MSSWQSLRREVGNPPVARNTFLTNGLLAGVSYLLTEDTPDVCVPFHSGPVLMTPRQGQIGTILVYTCWAVGMVAKASGELLQFLPDPLRNRSSIPPDVETLEASAQQVDCSFLASADSLLEIQLEEFIAKLEMQFPNFQIQPSPSAFRQWILIRIPEKACFTQLMDSCSASLDTVWTWSGTVVILGPVRSSSDDGTGNCFGRDLH